MYSIHGARGCLVKGPGGKLQRRRGNYLTYVQRANQIFGGQESIKRDTWNHMAKIRKTLTKPYPSPCRSRQKDTIAKEDGS